MGSCRGSADSTQRACCISRFVRLGARYEAGKAAGRTTSIPYGLNDPAAADVVCRMFQEFCDPYRRPSLSELAHDLNVDQVATARGGQWHASTVRYVLRNDAYVDLVGREMFDAAQARLSRLLPGPPR